MHKKRAPHIPPMPYMGAGQRKKNSAFSRPTRCLETIIFPTQKMNMFTMKKYKKNRFGSQKNRSVYKKNR